MIQGYYCYLKKVNGVHAVFLRERYCTYHHLSVKGVITVGKACYLRVRFENDDFRRN